MPTLSRIAIAAADYDVVHDHRSDVHVQDNYHAVAGGGNNYASSSSSREPMQQADHCGSGLKRKLTSPHFAPLTKKRQRVVENEGGGNHSPTNTVVANSNQGTSEQLIVHGRKGNNDAGEKESSVEQLQSGNGLSASTSTPVARGQTLLQHTTHPKPPITLTTTTPPSIQYNSMPSSVLSTSSSSSHLLTRVDGKGLWRSWKRNFKNKLLALLDLIDNSLDASIITAPDSNENGEGIDDDNEADHGNSRNRRSTFTGRIHIYPDDDGMHEQGGVLPMAATSSTVAAASTAAATTTATVTPTTPSSSGLCIINNSFHPIRSLVQVLEVYNSSKIHSGAHDIGENGVGLKQGCATLSDLSFVLVKNGVERYVELGIIAESLQLPEGCYLPSFRFNISDKGSTVMQSIKIDMMTLFSKPEHSDVARCIEQYGSSVVVTNNSRSPLERGVDRLCKYFHRILNFSNNLFVFAVILDNVTYGDRNSNGVSSQPAADPIKDLRLEIPRTYLHIPAGFDFRIGNSYMNRERIIFDYWPQRLVELSSLSVHVHENIPWHHASAAVGGYKLRVFAGFDRMRINSSDQVKSASMYVYSRQSGRLIKYEPDARFILGLNASGSTYGSGLTIIVDDIDGKLPLNPTKQDIAFGEQANGSVHKENLYMWVGAVSKFFYDHHLSKFDMKKTELTAKIKNFGPDITNTRMRVIDRCELSTYDLEFTFYGTKSIRVKRNPSEIVGRDTHFKLVPDAPPARASSSSDENGGSRRRSNHSQEQMHQQQYHPIMSSTSMLQATSQSRGTPLVETNCRQQDLANRMSQQAPAPMNNRIGHNSNTAGPPVKEATKNFITHINHRIQQGLPNRTPQQAPAPMNNRIGNNSSTAGPSEYPATKNSLAQQTSTLMLHAPPLVETTRRQQGSPNRMSHQAPSPNRTGLRLSYSFALSPLSRREIVFQAIINRHRDDVVRLMTACAAKGETSVSVNDIAQSRSRNFEELDAAYSEVLRYGGKQLTKDELQGLLVKAEQDAIELYRRGRSPVGNENAPVEEVLSGSINDDGDQQHEFTNDDDGNCSVSSSKSYYKELCAELTTGLEKKNETNDELRSEVIDLKNANDELRSEVTTLNEEINRLRKLCEANRLDYGRLN